MIAMSIAGYDPSGGAGILNDIKTFHALGSLWYSSDNSSYSTKP